MSKRLLDRQTSLIEHLASSAVIFGDKVDRPMVLQGIDDGLLHIEARFCYDKRMGKIAAIFPRTFKLLDGRRDGMFREFVEMYPPVHVGRLENARQFRDFLRDHRWGAEPYISDLAGCELACAEVRYDGGRARSEVADDPQNRRGIRRSPGTILLRCTYDVRWLFENDGWLKEGHTVVAPRQETLLIVARSSGTRQPQIFEVTAPVFDLAAALDDWTEAVCLGPEAEVLIVHLGRCGLIEARQ